MGRGDRLVSVGAHIPARLRYSTVARMIDHAETPGETMRTAYIRAVTTTDASRSQRSMWPCGFSPLMRRMALELDEVADDRRQAK